MTSNKGPAMATQNRHSGEPAGDEASRRGGFSNPPAKRVHLNPLRTVGFPLRRPRHDEVSEKIDIESSHP
jgi:hypothetical protein